MVPWSEYLRTITKIINGVKQRTHETHPEYVKNETDRDMFFCVTVQDDPTMEVVSLAPGESMSKYPKVTDVEAIIDDEGTITKLTGIMHEHFQNQQWITDNVCKYLISDEEKGIEKDCRIVDREKFREKTRIEGTDRSPWDRCLDHIPPNKDIQIQPGCGERDFDKCRDQDMDHGGGSDGGLVSVLRPIELPGGVYQVGYESLTHHILSPNFEGVSPAGWNYPVNFYNRLGYDGHEDAYYGDHIMDCHRIEGTGEAPHGIYQDLNLRIKGKIRFGVHAKRINGPEDAEITIAIWSLDRHESSFKRYRIPAGGWFDCYTDAEVEDEDRLRIEIYLPEGGVSYHLGGAYIVRQIS